MENLRISRAVAEKLARKHSVTRAEVEQCFVNRLGGLLEDTRARHRTEPPTQWFLATTHRGRLLKVVFVRTGSVVDLKTAYAPNQVEIDIYTQFG